jgi:hypothetical protein
MSQENVEIVRRIYDAAACRGVAARRDAATARILYDPEIVWDMRRAGQARDL